MCTSLGPNELNLVQVPSHYPDQCWSRSMTPNGFIKQQWVNSLRPRQNRRHFADDVFKVIFLNENVWISINISLKFVPRGPINSIPTLVQIMAWRRPGDKPLSEPMMVRLPTYICITGPQWVNAWCKFLVTLSSFWEQAIWFIQKCLLMLPGCISFLCQQISTITFHWSQTESCSEAV